MIDIIIISILSIIVVALIYYIFKKRGSGCGSCEHKNQCQKIKLQKYYSDRKNSKNT